MRRRAAALAAGDGGPHGVGCQGDCSRCQAAARAAGVDSQHNAAAQLRVVELMLLGQRARARSRALELTHDERVALLTAAELVADMLRTSAGRHMEVHRERFGD